MGLRDCNLFLKARPTAVRASFFWVEPGKKSVSACDWRKA